MDHGINLHIGPIVGSLRSTTVPVAPGHAPLSPPQPGERRTFVTISRQGGAGGHLLAKLLVERLNELDPGDRGWSVWDRELVEKVAADHHISTRMLESLEDSSRSWLSEMLSGLSFGSGPDYVDEFTAFRRVATTIRALAQVGRTIIVGRGGVYLTRNLPGGIHVRLVAPLKHRIDYMARLRDLSAADATALVKQIDKHREHFYSQYFPKEVMVPEAFTLTINTAAVPEEKLVDCVLPLIPVGVTAM